MFLSLLRGAMVVSKCQAMNKKKFENHACSAWLAITAIIVSTDVSHELRRGEG